jgi:deazaflavin-dependent oxidoreductase (nitroreductase family)
MLREKFVDRLRYFNKYVTNPLMKTFAGRFVYAVVHHTGRRSGRAYATPVLAVPVESGFLIPLPYGKNADWCRNVIASGGCEMEWRGDRISVHNPVLIDPQHALPVFPKWLHRLLRHTEVYLKLEQSPTKVIISDGVVA